MVESLLAEAQHSVASTAEPQLRAHEALKLAALANGPTKRGHEQLNMHERKASSCAAQAVDGG